MTSSLDIDCPFVLELEIDDEISFKPLPKKTSATLASSSAADVPVTVVQGVSIMPTSHRVLQPLHENKLLNHQQMKTPTTTPLKKHATPRSTIRMTEKKDVNDFENISNTIPTTSKITPFQDDYHRSAIMKSPTVVISSETTMTTITTMTDKNSDSNDNFDHNNNNDNNDNIMPLNIQMPSNLQSKRSFLDDFDNIPQPPSFVNCQNLISTCSTFLAPTSQHRSSDEGDEDSVSPEEILQLKIDDLEYRNSELIQEKEFLELRISELLASSRAGELSHADIQVKALTEQLERAKQNADLLVTEQTVELTNLRHSYEKRITEIITSNAQAVLDMQQRISNEMSQKWEKIYQEEKNKVIELTVSLQDATEKISSLEGEMTRVVYDTKKKAYEKVKAQFDAGNKEFQKLKGSLKDLAQEKEKYERKIIQQETTLTELKTEIKSLQDTQNTMRSQFSEVQSLLKSFPSLEENFNFTTDQIKENLTALKSHYELKFLQHQKTAMEWEENKSQMKCQIQQIEKDLQVSMKEKLLLNEQILKLQLEIQQKNEMMEGLGREVVGLKNDRESQLMAMASILQEKNLLEEEYKKKSNEVLELMARCDGLRQMNEEIVCMLEKVYSEKQVEEETVVGGGAGGGEGEGGAGM